MSCKYSASVQIMSRDWKADDFLPCSAVKLGNLFSLLWCCFSSHIWNTSLSFSIPIDSTCNVNGSAFQMDPLGCSISTYCTNPHGLAAGSLLLLCGCPCLRGQKPTWMLISQCLRVYKTAIFPQPWGIPWHWHIVFGLHMHQMTLSQNSKFVLGFFSLLSVATLKIAVEECVWVRFWYAGERWPNVLFLVKIKCTWAQIQG